MQQQARNMQQQQAQQQQAQQQQAQQQVRFNMIDIVRVATFYGGFTEVWVSLYFPSSFSPFFLEKIRF